MTASGCRSPTYRRPARLDAPLPQPHPRESLALASRRGIGFAAANGLPGAERIHDQLRTVLLQKHREWTGNGRVDLSGVDRVLLSGFGRPVLEGDLAGLLAGVEHPVRLGGETYHLSATATLLERVGGVTGDEARAMSINVRASRITAVDGHRDTSWRVGGFLGVRAKVELTPELKAQLGQAGLSGSFGGGTRHEFSGSAKASQRAEMGGKADEHVYNVVYELSVRSGDRVVRWWIDEPGEVVARVVLSQLHTPPEPIPADALADVGRIALWRALPAGSTVDFRTNGTGAVFRSFLAVSEVPRMAAHVYRQANRLPEEWLEERGNWPAELRKAFSPTELATHLTALTSDGGRLTELPDGTDGWHQALRVRVVFKDPRHVTAHGAGKPFQMWQNTSTSAKYARTDKRSRTGGAGAHVGLSVTLGAVSGLADGEDAGSPRAEGGGHGLTGHLYALGGGSLEREYRTEHGAATYPVGITRGTYSGPMHSYRADPVFEITLSRWAKGSVIDRLTGRPRGMQDITRVVEVKDGVEFVLPERRIFDLGLPVPEGVSVADPKTPEGHLDLAMLPGGTHPEVLHADGVLTAMKRWLTGQGLLRPGADGVVHVPTPLLEELEASFSSSALLNQFTLLTTSGVMRWWPLESAFGSTRYLWARVTAETLEPMSQMDRPEMAAMLRGKAFTELSTSTSRSTGGEAGIDLRAWLGGSWSAGVEGKAGYGESSETSHEKGDENVDIYWGQTKNPSVELRLRQRFRVQLRITRQRPELFSAPGRGLRKASLAVAGWTGHRREVAAGRQNTSLSDERFEAVTDGDVRVIVPRHLIVPGPPPPRSPAGAAGADPVWESSEPLPENRDLVDLVIEHGHPWALPAVAAVHRWAAVAGAPSLTRPGFAKPEIWRPEGTTVEGMLYDLFTNEVLMRLNLPSLLRFGYSVPVGPEKVVLGLRITHLTPMPQHDVDILSRHYNQGREVDENVRGGSRGLRLGLGLIGGGQPEEGGRVSDRLPLEYELELSDEQTTESQEIMERNVSSTRPFRYYRADVDVVIRSDRHGRLRVHVPDGLYLMLPTSLSGESALITNS